MGTYAKEDIVALFEYAYLLGIAKDAKGKAEQISAACPIVLELYEGKIAKRGQDDGQE